MATYNVFVVGPIDDSPSGLPQLVEAMARRYKLPADEVLTRMKKGRFRVKGGVDAATAERIKDDLQHIGARVVIEDAALSPTATPAAGVPITRSAASSSRDLPAQAPSPARSPVARAADSFEPDALGRAGPSQRIPVTRERPATSPPSLGPAGPSAPAPRHDPKAAPVEVNLGPAGPTGRQGPKTPVPMTELGPAGSRDTGRQEPLPEPSDFELAAPGGGAPSRVPPNRPLTPRPVPLPAQPARPSPLRDVSSRPAAAPARSSPLDSLLPPPTAPAPGGESPWASTSEIDLPPVTAAPKRVTPVGGTAAVGPSTRPSTPVSGLAAPGRDHPRPATPVPSGDFSSGLSAAFGSSTAPAADLGALGGAALALASLDGEEGGTANASFDLPPEEPAAPVVKFAPSAPKAKSEPRMAPMKAMDLFAPPDAGDQDLQVDLAAEEVDERARRAASAPAPVAGAPGSTLPSMRRDMSLPVALGGGEHPVFNLAKPPIPNSRFLAGIVLALVLGFIPTHFVAAMREKRAFATIDSRVNAAQASADTMETYLALDTFREKALDEKQSTRTMIALTSMLMWAVISAGIAFAYLRRPLDQPKKPPG